MYLKTIFPIFLYAISNLAQVSVHTVNVDRVVYNWKDSGVSCTSNVSSYWYVLKEEMDADIKQLVRYCGNSVLYIGIRNGLHLYNQGITVSCDSVSSFLKLDSNFINILPPVVEEKLSYNIYRDSGLYYVDSVNLVFKAQVDFSIPPDASFYEFLKTCVDSVEGEDNNTWVYGTREDMYCIAQNSDIKNVYDIGKDGPVNCKPIKIVPFKTNINTSTIEKGTYDLNGRIILDKETSTFYRIYHGKLKLKQRSQNK